MLSNKQRGNMSKDSRSVIYQKNLRSLKRFSVQILLFVFTFVMIGNSLTKAETIAKSGVLDLSNWNFESDGPLGLDGEWEFYWNSLLDPSDFAQGAIPAMSGYIDAPGYWDGYNLNGQELSGIGYASFRLKIINLDSTRVFMLDLPLMHTAYKLWINGELISTNGVVGMEKSTSVPQYLPKTPIIRGFNSELDIVLQISNFHHNNGGIWQTLRIGLEEDIIFESQTRTAFDLFLLGASFIMALYHFALFALRRKETSTMFFGLFCLIVSFRISTHGSTILSVMFPDLSWELLVKLDYFTLYFGLSFYCAFIHRLYLLEFPQKVLNLILVLSWGFAIFSVVTPATVFTAYLKPYQAIMAASCLFVSYVLVRAIMAKREGAKVILAGCSVIIICFVNDVLYNAEVIHTADMMGAGLFVMIFLQSYVLSAKFSKAFDMVEVLSIHLDQKVKERTAAIKDLLDNTGQGFFSFAKDFRIQKFTSKATVDFFKRSIENEDALALMFPESSSERKQVFNLVFDQSGDLDMVQELLPKEINQDGRIYHLDYHWIEPRENIDGRMMIVMTDITTQRNLENQLKKDEVLNQMIVKIAVDRHGFIGFINEVKKCMGRVDEILNHPLHSMDTEELFRHLHTVKGGMASYFFNDVAEKAHEIENTLDKVRTGEEPISQEFVDNIKKEVSVLNELQNEALQNLERIVPKELIDAGQQPYFRIPEAKIIKLENSLKDELKNNRSVFEAVTGLRKQPIRNVMKKFASDAGTLAENLGKKVKISLHGEQNEIIHAPLKPLFSSLIHLVRNSVDHGIESPEARTNLGKEEAGQLDITISPNEEHLKIVISDDGAGIDLDRIKTKAIEKSLITEEQAATMSNDEIVKLIFKPGFSTNEAITDLSGRGVGMDAVADEVKKLSGSIKIQTQLNKGTQFIINIPDSV